MAVTEVEREMVEDYDLCGQRVQGHCRDCLEQAEYIEEIRSRM